MQNELPIILTFDAKFARPAFTVMQSIMDTAKAEQFHNFYVLHETLPDALQEVGRSLFNTENSTITFLNVSKEMQQARPRRGPRPIFYRLLIPELFRDFDNVLYLDSDVIVVKDIYTITQDLPAGKFLGAIEDTFLPPSKDGVGWVSFADDIPYFNSGVLLFRPKLIPRKQAQMCIRLCARAFPSFDQDILNLVFHDDVYFLKTRWNFLIGHGDVIDMTHANSANREYILRLRQEERPHARILHFVGNKPWADPNLPNSEYFWEAEKSLADRFYNAGGKLLKHYLPLP